jgi:ActR/RegA family two-component response regulator
MARAHAIDGTDPFTLILPLADVRRRHILSMTRQANGNVTQAARLLGIRRQSLQRILKRWSLDPCAVVFAPAPADQCTLAALEDAHILRTLALSGGNVTLTARRLGVRRQSLQRKLKKVTNPAGCADRSTSAASPFSSPSCR